KIYHNPRCSKSRQTLAILNEHGHAPQTFDYRAAIFTAEQLIALRAKLGFDSVRQMMRTGEAIYKEQNLKSVSDEARLIDAIIAHPILLERPIVETASAAKIGRPPESVLTLF
ncbi:MAG: arsenate reductase (glutaredoxin), partial [Robiginitomaculum sp.]